jgi:putative thioredoxin
MDNSKFGSLPKGFGRAVDLSSLARPTNQGSQSNSTATSGEPGDSVIVDVSEENLVAEFIEYSAKTPAFIFIWSDRAKGSREMLDTLDRLARQDNGAWRLGAISYDAQPELVSALRITAVPAAVALIQQQVLPIPTLPPEEASLRLMINRILEVAEQQGLTISRTGATRPETSAPVEQKSDPEEDEAYAAIERGDFDRAAEAYKRLLARRPNDSLAEQALAQCELMLRTKSVDPKRAIEDSERNPDDLDLLIQASDVQVAMGQLEEAFTRLITFIKHHPGDERKRARDHLLTLFSLIPAEDPILLKARRELASALF